MPLVPLSYEEVVFLNEFVVSQTSETSGEDGVFNESNVRYCCQLLSRTIYGKEQFEGLMKKAAALLECIARSHGFVNANKRTSIAATNLFLYRNGWQFRPDSNASNITLKAASKGITIEEIEEWIMNCSKPKY